MRLSLVVSGNPYPTLQWHKNGFPLVNQTSEILVLPNAKPSDSGTFTCVLTNMAGTFTWTEASVSVT